MLLLEFVTRLNVKRLSIPTTILTLYTYFPNGFPSGGTETEKRFWNKAIDHIFAMKRKSLTLIGLIVSVIIHGG